MLIQLLRKITPKPLIQGYHYALARFAAFGYRYPSKELVVIGVTGTNGKSTTTEFIGRMLESMGERIGWTTTASFKVAEREWVNDQKMTMLGRFQTQKMLRDMVKAGCTYAIVETSSQGIVQSRHVGIDYDVAVFTNLTPEHIEAHGGFENYKQAKGKLFEVCKGTHVINLDDAHADFFLNFEAETVTGFGLRNSKATQVNAAPVVPDQVELSGACTTFVLGDLTMHLKTIGQFYLQNALAAITTVRALGVDWEDVQRAAEQLEPIGGRLEQIDEGQAFHVVVDYAYEPAALNAAYEALELIEYNRLIHIVGSAGGGRDVARREVLGEMVAEHDDIVIVANEDPYDEDPMQIINDVADAAVGAGMKDGVNVFRILDRQEAIDYAIKIAEPNDLVLITGKGSEPVMAVANGKKVPWDDRQAARKSLTSL
ncbi:UDP-N-acetylmuramyl-tripeptide synthetase [Candidatus Uhrbacteria bacterium]|nr:UDP-N-acetylmuramyl-tripeptide synthetase [Candidatus Uhrbacteria bacterium]